MTQNPSLPAASGSSRLRFALRVALVALQLVLVYYLGDQGMKFFYQGF